MDTNKHVAIVGGGPAGIVCAQQLADKGVKVTLLERNPQLCSNIANKYKLFPNFADANMVAQQLIEQAHHNNITVIPNAEVKAIHANGQQHTIDYNSTQLTADAVLVATGYNVFDAKRKEELGYGIYPGVITSLELEAMMKKDELRTPYGDKPKRIVFLQCVGSRDAKVGNHYCSKLCCVTAVKQAIEVTHFAPDVETFVFYMDLRMWGEGFEEMYRNAQEEHNVHFVRGRISEAAATFDGQIQIKAEDTLIGQPLKLKTDYLVLMVGMEPACGAKEMMEQCGIAGNYGFVESIAPHLNDNITAKEGIFAAGACKRPFTLSDTVADAKAAAIEIESYLAKL